jgi:uncharacterized protein YjiS (DUF1127 family)
MNRSRLRGYQERTTARQLRVAPNKDKAMFIRRLAALCHWIRYRSNRNVLATLDDHILLDIGLARADLYGTSRKFSRWYRM